MKIALIGYGRMGKAIEEIALKRGHEVVARIDIDNQQDFDSDAFASADVAIEFTNASQAPDNFHKAWNKGVPVVSGTTGETVKRAIEEMKADASKKGHTLMHSSNFSIGVNLLFAVNRYLARLTEPFDEYKVAIDETHHIHKLDHPSGTGITLAEQIIANNDRYTGWEESSEDEPVAADMIPMHCLREGENPGFHEVKWSSEADSISISHQANSRAGFALGSVLAAEWIVKQPRGKFYSINDMFNF